MRRMGQFDRKVEFQGADFGLLRSVPPGLARRLAHAVSLLYVSTLSSLLETISFIWSKVPMPRNSARLLISFRYRFKCSNVMRYWIW